MQTFQSPTTRQLAAKVTLTPHGHHLMLSSFCPTAQRQEHLVKFSGTFTAEELRILRNAIDLALRS